LWQLVAPLFEVSPGGRFKQREPINGEYVSWGHW
jgi:hypothetical protein